MLSGLKSTSSQLAHTIKGPWKWTRKGKDETAQIVSENDGGKGGNTHPEAEVDNFLLIQEITLLSNDC